MNTRISWALVGTLTAASIASAAPAGTIHVPAEFLTLQAAIVAAEPGDEIIVAPGTYNEAINFNGKTITLRSSAGPSRTTIDAAGLNLPVVRIVSGEGEGTTLEGFTITGGVGGGFPSGGGGLHIINASPAIIDCIITGNSAAGVGGGILIVSSTASILGCIFADNSSSSGGGIHLSSATVAFADTVFSGNTALRGGGVALEESSTMTAVNCQFLGNSTGGVNSAGGGGVYVNSHSVAEFTNCTFTNNVKGGAMCCGNFHMGGAVAVANHLSGGPGTAHFAGCTFTGNTSNSWGGAIGAGNDSTLTVTDCVFTTNQASMGGAAIYANSAVNVTHSTFLNNFNQANGGTTLHLGGLSVPQPVVGCTFIGNSSGNGAGAFQSAVSVSLIDCHFENNVAGGNIGGGAVMMKGGSLQDTTFTNNTSPGSGGGVSVGGATTITGSSFIGNVAAITGGGVHANNPTTLRDCTFLGNTANGSPQDGPWGGGGGANLSSGTAINCLFHSNFAVANGGALRINGNGSVINCTVIDNTSSSGTLNTGGILLASGAITNSIVRGNSPNQFFGNNLVVSFSNIQQGGFAGEGNINADPLFVDAAGGDYRLTAKSPSVDSGNTIAVPDGVFTDLDGNARVVNCVVDQGAYEAQDIDGNPADLNGDGAVDVSDLLVLLSSWGSCPDGGPCTGDINCDGAVDVSDLLILLANWGS